VPLACADEEALLRTLEATRPGVVLECGDRRSTFLPQVWDQLPDAREFLAHLKAKAGLPPTFWSDDMRVSTYTVEKWSEQ
jgi:AMMECR1 domain-containing protein